MSDATAVHQNETALVSALIQLIVIILAARLSGNAAVALKQPRAVGEIIAGLALGPSLFGALAPGLSHALFTPESAGLMFAMSQIGLILLMFQIGGDFEFSRLNDARARRAVLFIMAASLVAPLATGFAAGWLSAPFLASEIAPLPYALFVSIAFAITAVPILGRILREYGMTRTETGVIAISAAAGNDVVGWVLLASVAAYASAGAAAASPALQIAGLIALLAFVRFAGPGFVRFLLRRFPLVDAEAPPVLMSIVLAMIFAGGVATQRLGIFTIFGGFLMGLLFHPHPAFIESWRRQVGQFVLVLFLPIFFTYTGLRTNVLGLDSLSDWAWCGGLFLAAIASKIVPTCLAARAAGLAAADAKIIGVLMNTRALMELIVLNIGLSLGFIPEDVFTMLVIMAIGTTVMTGPLLHRLLKESGRAALERVDA